MFSGSRDAPPPPYASEGPSETSLTSLLPTPAHRVECALLILLCTDELRRSIASTFDLPENVLAVENSNSNTTEDLISLDGPTREEIRLPRREGDTLLRQQELSSPATQALKRASFTYFDSWRAKLLRRVCDALNVRADTVRLARKQRTAQAGTADKHQDLVNWARTNNEPDPSDKNSQYKAVATKLIKLEEEKRVLLLQCLVLLLLSLETYPAHSRILLLHITSSLGLENSSLVQHESQIARGLLEAASQMSGEEARKARAAENAASSKWKIGLATVAGAALIGVTGGLAAPLLAAGLGTVFGGLGLGAVSGLLGALAGNTLLISGLFGAYGGNMTGKMMENYEKEVEDFKFLPIRCRDEDTERHQDANVLGRRPPAIRRTSAQTHKLRVAIGISGSLTSELDMIAPWSILDGASLEPFALRWEVAALLRLGISLSSVLKSYAWKYAKWEIARRTIFGALAAGLWPLGLLKLARVIDNPFSVARARADKAGMVLASALMAKCQGERPVTLIGYSVGSRVIYSCLLELAAQKAFGLIENVVLIGSPVPSDSEPWTRVRSVVCGRVINVFSTEDYILGFLYRASSGQFEVAGLQTVKDVNGVENYDVSDLVSGHAIYRYVVGQILQRIGLDDVDPREVEKEVAILQALESEESRDVEQAMDTSAEQEASEIESRVRDRVGSPVGGRIVMIDVDEHEEQRRQELLHVAEEKARAEDHPPAYEEFHAPTPPTRRPPTSERVAPRTGGPQQASKAATQRNPSSFGNTVMPAADSAGTGTTVPKKPSVAQGSLVTAAENLHIVQHGEEDAHFDNESEVMREMSHMEPEPIEDDENEVKQVRVESPNRDRGG